MARKSEDWHDKYLDDAASTIGEACADGGWCGAIVMGILALVAAIGLLFRKKK